MGIVEIRPKSGVYDYASKYTKGATEYFAPAPLDEAVTAQVQRAAETAFAACGCRDYARVDFILADKNLLYLLEINTLPGMKETSLLPMSARCAGLDFTALVREMVRPALQRFASSSRPSAQRRYSSTTLGALNPVMEQYPPRPPAGIFVMKSSPPKIARSGTSRRIAWISATVAPVSFVPMKLGVARAISPNNAGESFRFDRIVR